MKVKEISKLLIPQLSKGDYFKYVTTLFLTGVVMGASLMYLMCINLL